jgi:hypothetical protein
LAEPAGQHVASIDDLPTGELYEPTSCSTGFAATLMAPTAGSPSTWSRAVTAWPRGVLLLDDDAPSIADATPGPSTAENVHHRIR